jgi:predicted ABC-type ATPase
MNWIIFTTECSGKTTFCSSNQNKLKEYDLVDWDIIKALPNGEYENEILLIDVMMELSNKDNQIYLTNIVPPNFILDCKHYYKNIKFGIVNLENDELALQINKRHNSKYNSNYIIEKNNRLKTIVDKKDTFKTFKNFNEFKNYFEPTTISQPMIQRIIRL